jgi:two-component system response regulator CssR
VIINLVEDDKNIATILKTYLEKEKYTVFHFSSEKEALKHITPAPNLWILDVMLEDQLSGFHIYQAIKLQALAPTIFLSARDQEYDRIMGLEQGADDYITKPFSPRELVLKVNRLMARVYPKITELIIYGPYEINPQSRSVSLNGTPIELSAKEFELLIYLILHKGAALSRNDILDGVWEKNYFGSDRVVDDLLRRLRSRLPELKVSTVYGYGYRLE